MPVLNIPVLKDNVFQPVPSHTLLRVKKHGLHQIGKLIITARSFHHQGLTAIVHGKGPKHLNLQYVILLIIFPHGLLTTLSSLLLPGTIFFTVRLEGFLPVSQNWALPLSLAHSCPWISTIYISEILTKKLAFYTKSLPGFKILHI